MGRLCAAWLVVAVWVVPAAADAYTLRTTEDGRPVYWADTDVAFRVDATLARAAGASEVGRTVAESLASWGGLPSSPFLFEGDPRPVGRCDPDSGDGVADVVLMERAWPFDRDFAGVTILLYDVPTAQILDADVFLNGEDFAFAVDPDDWRSYDLGNVLTHELGHLLGLGHSDDQAATMFAVSGPNETAKRSLADDDAAGFAQLYGGLGPAASAAGCRTVPGACAPNWAWAVGLALLLGARRRTGAATRRLSALVSACLVLGAASSTGFAASGRALPLEELAQRAEVVVRGTVVARQARWAGRLIVTDVTVAVSDCWRGRCGEQTRVVRELGGEVYGIGMLAPEPTAMPLDAEVVVFAIERSGVLVPLGGAQGVFRIEPRTDDASRSLPRGLGPLPTVISRTTVEDLRFLVRSEPTRRKRRGNE